MIFITVKAAFMECKKQFEKDIKAEQFLKRVKEITGIALNSSDKTRSEMENGWQEYANKYQN